MGVAAYRCDCFSYMLRSVESFSTETHVIRVQIAFY